MNSIRKNILARAKGIIKGGVSSIPLGGGLVVTATVKLTAVASSELFEYGANTALGLEIEEKTWTDIGSDWIVDAGVSTGLAMIGPSVDTKVFDLNQIKSQAYKKGATTFITPPIQEFSKITLTNAINYDPWRDDYYWIQPKTVIFDWDKIEAGR